MNDAQQVNLNTIVKNRVEFQVLVNGVVVCTVPTIDAVQRGAALLSHAVIPFPTWRGSKKPVMINVGQLLSRSDLFRLTALVLSGIRPPTTTNKT